MYIRIVITTYAVLAFQLDPNTTYPYTQHQRKYGATHTYLMPMAFMESTWS